MLNIYGMEKMKIAICSDSTCDLSQELINQYNIKIIRLTVVLGDESGLDGKDITPEKIFEYGDTHKDLPHTCAVNEYQYDEFFTNILNEGYDALIFIGLSSALSSSFRNAQNAASNFKNIYVVDSLSLSTGIGLQVIYAAKLAQKGLSPEEIVKKVENRRKYVQASFFVDTIDYLYKGGRCSMLSMLGATLLRIKPQIVVTNEGKMIPGSKYFGRKTQVAIKYVEETLDRFNNPDKSLIFITHTHANQEVVDIVRETLKSRGITETTETFAGATITSHCGKGTLGVLYYNDGGEEE